MIKNKGYMVFYGLLATSFSIFTLTSVGVEAVPICLLSALLVLKLRGE